MTPKQVRSLLAVNQYGSINKASEVLHLAPSTISAQLKELSLDLGVELFENKGRNIQLNETGKSLLPSFQAFCVLENQIKQLALNYQDTLLGSIRLFAPSSLCIYRLPFLIEKLQESEPELEVILIHEPYDYEAALKQADIDAAIIMTEASRLKTVTQEWHSTPLKKEHVIYVASPHYLNTHKPLTLSELSQYALITTEMECSYRKVANQHFAQAGISLTPKQSFSNVEVIKRCLLAKMGIGLLPKCVVQDELAQGSLLQIAVEGTPYQFHSHIISHKKRIINKKLDAFLALL